MTSEYIVVEKCECHNCGHKGLTDTEYVEIDGRRVSEGYVECPNCGEEKFAFCGVLKNAPSRVRFSSYLQKSMRRRSSLCAIPAILCR